MKKLVSFPTVHRLQILTSQPLGQRQRANPIKRDYNLQVA